MDDDVPVPGPDAGQRDRGLPDVHSWGNPRLRVNTANKASMMITVVMADTTEVVVWLDRLSVLGRTFSPNGRR